ncbi:MAG TPA: class I SAM-dependent methyltransferase [Candidatus Moranbacteria bacterium]|nr:class I SAM-dependent methyltransferase [Candidatus Moranbacteria bacterium]
MEEFIHEFKKNLKPLNSEEKALKKRIDNNMENVSPEEYDTFVLGRERDETARVAKDKLESFLDKEKEYLGLELGSGTGIYTKELNSIPNLKLIGMDNLRNMVDFGTAQKRFSKEQVIEGDFHEMSFDENSFDLATGLAITKQRKDIPKFYSELKRILKENGFVFLPFVTSGKKIIEKEIQLAEENGFEIMEKGDWYILAKNVKV